MSEGRELLRDPSVSAVLIALQDGIDTRASLFAAACLWWSPVRARLDTRARRVALSAVAVVAINYLLYLPYVPLPEAHLRLAGPDLHAALPSNAAILTANQGAGLAHFTKRLIVRIDAVARAALDGVVADLERRGYRPVFVLESGEASWFRTHFAPSQLRALDWPPRAQVLTSMTYWDPADRAAHARGLRWPTDVISLP